MKRTGGKRGRPTGTMTHNRRAVLHAMAEASQRGEKIGLMELARRCGLYSYKEAKRTVTAIRRYGLEAVE